MSLIWKCLLPLLLAMAIQQSGAIAQPAGAGAPVLIAISPEVRSMCEQAEQLINSRRFNDAEQLLRRAATIDPNCAEVHGYLGMAYQNSQKTKQAIVEYQQALQLGPQMSFLNVNLGNCFLNIGQSDEAVPHFERYLQENPNAPDAAQVRMSIQQAGTRKGQQDLQSVVQQGQSLLNQHRYNEARQAFEQAVSAKPDWAPGHFFLGYALAQSGDHQQAISQFQSALQFDPNMSEAVMNIASNYQSLGDSDSAITWYERFLQQNPGSPKAGDIRNRINGLRQQASKQGQQPRQQSFLPPAASAAGSGTGSGANPPANRNSQAAGLFADSDPYAGMVPPGASLPAESAASSVGQGAQGGQNSFRRSAQPGQAGQSADDYLESAVSDGKCFRWSADKMPIRVYIYPGAGTTDYRDSFARVLADSFSVWQKGAESRVSFWIVQDPAQADITCDWTSNPATIQNAGGGGEGGLTKLSGQAEPDGHNVKIVRARISLLTKPRGAMPISDDEMKKVCLHEIGHALGLNGHSNDNHDVMFFSESPSVWPALTKRDKATICRLYANYPKTVDAVPVR
jgi:tetratricopeptide (TPR) repeat protein/predicted Zn-dependent protease